MIEGKLFDSSEMMLPTFSFEEPEVMGKEKHQKLKSLEAARN